MRTEPVIRVLPIKWRSHRQTQGGLRRDTIIFSIIRSEWDTLRRTIFAEYDARG